MKKICFTRGNKRILKLRINQLAYWVPHSQSNFTIGKSKCRDVILSNTGVSSFKMLFFFFLSKCLRDFPGSPVVVNTLPFSSGDVSLILDQRIPQPQDQKAKSIKWKQYCNKFNKTFRNSPHKKKILKKNELPWRSQ